MFLFTMGNKDNQKANSINKIIRGDIISMIDLVFLGLLSWVFQLFFNVTSVEIFSGEFIMNFYSRVQVILGVFMMFQLAMTIIKGIVDPDSFNDKKTGAASLIRRIAVALVMLVLLVPIRYNNPANEYETQLNNNGILFGTLYSLQYRILKDNTLGKIIFGDQYEDHNYMGDPSTLKNASNKFVGSIIRSFYRINLNKENGDINNKEDWMCGDENSGWPKGVFEAYTDENTSPNELISLVDESCKSKKKFVLAYTPILPAIVGIIMSILILSFTIDVAIRTIKLGILKLVAPIPIISYMDPKGSKDSAFNSWVKQLTSTYIDLFVRLAIIYLAVYLVIEISQNGLIVTDSVAADGGVVWVFTKIVIYIALFAFAKQAPKFLKDMFGIKDDGTGLSGMFKGLGVATAVGGAIGSARIGYKAAKEENAELRPNKSNFVRNVGAGLASAIGGGAAGINAAMGKDGSPKTALKAQAQRNAQRMAHSTAPGRFADSIYQVFSGQSLADKESLVGNVNKEAAASLKKWKENVSDEAVKNGGAFNFQLANGQQLNGIRYSEVAAAKETGADSDGNITINGTKYAATLFGTDVMSKLKDEQTIAWQNNSIVANGKSYKDVVTGDGKLAAAHERITKAVNDAQISHNGQTGSNLIDDYNNLGPAIGIADRAHQATETNMRQRMRIANKQENKK